MGNEQPPGRQQRGAPDGRRRGDHHHNHEHRDRHLADEHTAERRAVERGHAAHQSPRLRSAGEHQHGHGIRQQRHETHGRGISACAGISLCIRISLAPAEPRTPPEQHHAETTHPQRSSEQVEPIEQQTERGQAPGARVPGQAERDRKAHHQRNKRGPPRRTTGQANTADHETAERHEHEAHEQRDAEARRGRIGPRGDVCNAAQPEACAVRGLRSEQQHGGHRSNRNRSPPGAGEVQSLPHRHATTRPSGHGRQHTGADEQREPRERNEAQRTDHPLECGGRAARTHGFEHGALVPHGRTHLERERPVHHVRVHRRNPVPHHVHPSRNVLGIAQRHHHLRAVRGVQRGVQQHVGTGGVQQAQPGELLHHLAVEVQHHLHRRTLQHRTGAGARIVERRMGRGRSRADRHRQPKHRHEHRHEAPCGAGHPHAYCTGSSPSGTARPSNHARRTAGARRNAASGSVASPIGWRLVHSIVRMRSSSAT
ncbi:unannotated protein [freshwater metagenome]|uniref:Unannotated protein n=1 Tax=freshwater metagenome TaxID=449393 RepID=A0A6J6SD77_9ZZZZ